MAKQPLLKTRVTKDKLVIEISLHYIRAQVAAANRRACQATREEPQDPWPLFRVTNGKAFMKFLLAYLMKGYHHEVDKLPHVIDSMIAVILDDAAAKGAGIELLPWAADDPNGKKWKAEVRRQKTGDRKQ